MKKLTASLAVLFLLSAVALSLSFTPTASALIMCEDCTSLDSPDTRCFGTCQGKSFQYCGDWLAYGCPTLQFAPGTPDGLLEASCDAPALAVEAAPTETALPVPDAVLDGVEPWTLN